MTAFISGHRDLNEWEFEEHYVPAIKEAMARGDDILVCDYWGADQMAQEYLYNHEYDKVNVLHMLTSPRVNVGEFPTIGGFKTDDERDTYGTYHSDYDIAWSRKVGSGTWQNIQRRTAKAESPIGIAG